MKKLLFLSFVSLALLFSGCEKVDDPNTGDNNQPSANQLLGSWVMAGEDYTISIVFNESGWIENDGENTMEGTYTLDGDVLTMKIGDSLVNQVRVIMPCDNVLVMRFHSDMGEGWGLADEFGLYFRENSSVDVSADDIQGKWFWYFRGDTNIIRMSLEITGNTFDFIIPVWHERMKGTFEYSNGKINFHVTEFLTRGNLEEGNESRENLYKDWVVSTGDSWPEAPSFGYEFSKAFVPNGGEAFAVMANLPAYFVKQ